MTPWARSGTSQKSGASILAVSSANCFCLVATSKRVPEVGDAAEQVVGAAAQVGVHPRLLLGPEVPDLLTIPRRPRIRQFEAGASLLGRRQGQRQRGGGVAARRGRDELVLAVG